MSIIRATLAVCMLAASLSLPQPAKAFFSLEGFDRCDTGWVLSYIQRRFDSRVRNHLKSDLFITGIYEPVLLEARPRDEEHNVGRQYCRAKVTMTDRSIRPVFYILEYPWGFAGQLTHVEFCIPDLDPWHVYGRKCSAIRPAHPLGKDRVKINKAWPVYKP